MTTREVPRRFGVDVVLALAVTVVVVWGCYSESNPSAGAAQMLRGHVVLRPPAWAYLPVVAAGLALAWRRRRPRTVLGVSLAGVLTFTALGYIGYAALIIPPIALYTVALTAGAGEAAVLALATLLALGGVVLAGPDRISSGDIGLAGLVAVAALGGIAGANRRRYIEAVRARAELLERTQQETTRRSVDAERLRIARELHDVVAHTMATINVQAGVASYVSSDLPPSAAEALRAIKTASKDGLRELRAILNVLRQADDLDSAQPQPGLGRLDALVAGAGAAGLPTAVVTSGHPSGILPPAVDLAAYRIAQESLTNAIRHAGPATATIHVTYGLRELSLRITDTGTGPPPIPSSAGHGIIGMHERAAAAGGRLDTGRAPDGGFEVIVRLPLEARS